MKNRLSLSFVLGLPFAALLTSASILIAQSQPSVQVFSPQGIVKKPRQVRVQFSEAMVPFGFLKQPVKPFDTNCAELGSERWADEKNWLFDFKEDLSAGIKCRFTMKSGLTTISGKEVGGQKVFEFSTGGPAVVNSRPWNGAYIAEDQIFVLRLDTEVDESSVISGLGFQVAGLREKVGARIVTGSERQAILKTQYNQDEPQRIVLVQSKQTFPYGAKVKLIWGRSITSKSGVPGDQDQILEYTVRNDFTASFSCERENAQADCIPMLPAYISFSSPISKEQALRVVIRGAGKTFSPKLSEDDEDPGISGVSVPGPFPENTDFRVELPGDLRDDANRPLSNANRFPLSFRTASYPPLAKFAAPFGILELKEGGLLPVTLRNIEAPVPVKYHEAGEGMPGRKIKITPENADQVLYWMRRVSSHNREKSIFQGQDVKISDLRLPRPNGDKAFEVIGIPLGGPGFYVIELESRILGNSLLGQDKPLYVPAAALVTNLSVHFKWGRESSLVWVTTLDAGKPVAKAEVAVRDCNGTVWFTGSTDSEGTVRTQSIPENAPSCSKRPFSSGLLVTAVSGGDMGLVHTDWNDGIETWRFNLPYGGSHKPLLGHTIFARTLLRAGDTLNMKHLIRRHQMSGFGDVAPGLLPSIAVVTHAGSGQEFTFPLQWERGASETTWRIPTDAKLGEYTVAFKGGSLEYAMDTGSFQVEEFRVPLMRGIIKPPAEPVVRSSGFPVDIALSYLSGGGASNASVRVRYAIRASGNPEFRDLDDYVMANGSVKEGTVAQGDENSEEPSESPSQAKVKSQDITLDRSGTSRVRITDLPSAETMQSVETEMEFRDPNGVVQTVSRTIPVYPSVHFIGIKQDAWMVSKDNLKFQVIVVDLKGNPVAGTNIRVDAYERKNFSHRKRLVGGYYAYDSSTETKKFGSLCEGKTDYRGIVLCQTKVDRSGNILLGAFAKDSQGNTIAANREIWVAGSDAWWFRPDEGDRMDLLAEKKRYEPGEIAKLQVRMPFSKATALVTVEREGIVEKFVRELSGKEPVIEIPVKGNYAPNIFVSVMAVRGRSGETRPTALVDLGKPSYRLGIAQIVVGQKAHELSVKVEPENDVYPIRGKARVKVTVRGPNGMSLPPNSEVALAAVDEGLLELKPNTSWNVLPSMMGSRGLEVRSSTAQMQVVGRRHFGLKALPPGGGGGQQMTRELFDTLLLWKGRVKLDSQGEATVEIPLNDSLTAFKIAAVATGGAGFFGTGTASIRTTQDLMLLPGIPPLVREGDKFRSEFTLRNTTNRSMSVELSARISASAGEGPVVPAQKIDLSAGEAREVGWDINVPAGISSLTYDVQAVEAGGNARERVKIVQKVIEAIPVRTFQATLEQIDKEYVVPVEKPKDAIAGRGDLRVNLSPSLTGSLEGVREYMKKYPYTCMEQRVSRSISLRDPKMWAETMERLPLYLDSEGFVKFFPEMRFGSELLTAYILAISAESGYEIPAGPREKMIQALQAFMDGKISRQYPLNTTDLSLRKLTIIEALSRYGESKPQMLETIQIQPNLWPTSAVIDWYNILERTPSIVGRTDRMKEAQQILRSRLSFQGTTMSFSTEGNDYMWWLLTSPDMNAIRMTLAVMKNPDWRADLPRIMRGTIGRQRKGSWDLTLANAWGVLAVEKFASEFERITVGGTTSASLGDQTRKLDWSKARGGDLILPWPANRTNLSVRHDGAGKPWALLQSRAAIPLKEDLHAGFRIKKSWKMIEQKKSGIYSRGDIVRVTLKITADADRTWVVVSDPVPAGATILGTGLGTESSLMQQGEKREGWAWPAYEERSFEAFRSYYEYAWKGEWTVEYTMRLNQSGNFQLPQTRVEAMYSPEMFAESPNEVLSVMP